MNEALRKQWHTMNSTDPALNQITCPNCGERIPISEAISHQIAERARAESKAELLESQRALAAKERGINEREANLERRLRSSISKEAVCWAFSSASLLSSVLTALTLSSIAGARIILKSKEDGL
jgi:hypothetical protein